PPRPPAPGERPALRLQPAGGAGPLGGGADPHRGLGHRGAPRRAGPGSWREGGAPRSGWRLGRRPVGHSTSPGQDAPAGAGRRERRGIRDPPRRSGHARSRRRCLPGAHALRRRGHRPRLGAPAVGALDSLWADRRLAAVAGVAVRLAGQPVDGTEHRNGADEVSAFRHAEAFWAALGSARGMQDRPSIEARLAAQLATARERWSEVQVDGAAFATHWAEQLSRAADPDAALDQLHVADLYLAFACAAGDANALRAFAAQLASAGAAVRGVDASPAFVDEVLQRLQTRVLVAEAGCAPRILEYAGRGSLEN